MAVPAPEHLNRPFWEMLRLGREAPTAHWFDIDWEAGDGRIGLPFLGAPLEELLAQGELSVGEHDGEPVLRYADHRFPLAPGSETARPRGAARPGSTTRSPRGATRTPSSTTGASSTSTR